MANLPDEMNEAALEAMKLTRKYFVVELDFSESSIQSLDPLFNDVEFTMRGGKSDDNVELLTRVWGAYLGEVIRRNIGGQWTSSSESGIGLQRDDNAIHPHDAVRKRLVDESADTLWQFYQQHSSSK